jgi:hypothetical protein
VSTDREVDIVKRFSCRLGRHTWTTHVEQGESYTVCSGCGKTPSRPKGNIEGPPHDYFGWRTKTPPKLHDGE